MSNWNTALALDASRGVCSGSDAALADAIRKGADLRIATEFRHNEHIDVTSERDEIVHEVAEFAVTYLVQDRWTAGIMSLRQPVELPTGFGPRPSMSYFLYNQDGRQAIARLHLDEAAATGPTGATPTPAPANMPRYHVGAGYDAGTNAPSHNFVYDFGLFRYWVRDRWTEVLAHGADGTVISGSLQALRQAQARGCSIKVGVSGLCDDLADDTNGGTNGWTNGGQAMPHEVFVETGSTYSYTERGPFIAGSHPVVRVRAAVPMAYCSRGWDSGWLVVHTDGTVVYRRCDPYTLAFEDRTYRCQVRWFAA